MPKRERDALAHVPLFEGLSPRHLRRLADLTQEDRLMAGATIVRAGEPGDVFYVIIEGEAKVVNASNRVVNRLQPGDSFGEISLLDGGPRTATVVAETPMRVATLERKSFLRTLEAEPAVALKLLIDAAKLLRRLERPAAG
jgi:CRP/FNR family transcriptional regulator, cyclic AMP receptor protein